MNLFILRVKLLFFYHLNAKNLKTTLYTLLLMVLGFSFLQAQDIHYSQFYNAPMLQSPGLTGVFPGDTRFMANYRTQWKAVPVDYLTFSGAADVKFYPRNLDKNGLFAAGLIFHYDQAGLSKLQLIQLALNGSYSRRLTEYAFLTVGGQIAGNQRGFNLGALSFDEEFDKGRGRYDPSLPNNEVNLSTNKLFLDFSVGINLRMQSLSQRKLVDNGTKRDKLDVGIGIFHLNRPNQSFFDGYKSPLFMRFSPYIAGAVKIDSLLDVVGHINAQFQGPYQEVLGMVGLKYYLNLRPDNRISVQAGVGYRFDDFGDSFYPTAEVGYKGWNVGLSYDVNVSSFQVATGRRGGPEISLRYIIDRVPREVKVCPFM